MLNTLSIMLHLLIHMKTDCPRKIKNWLGEMIPDNEQAGYDLIAKELLL